MFIHRGERENGHTAKAAWQKKKNGQTLYKVVPERSQCELNGLRILDGQWDILTGYRSKSSQVEKTKTTQLVSSHSQSWNTPTNNTRLPAGQWKCRTTTGNQRLDCWQQCCNCQTGPTTPLRLHSNSTLATHKPATFLPLATFTRARLPNSNSERMWTGNQMGRLSTWPGVKLKNTIKNKNRKQVCPTRKFQSDTHMWTPTHDPRHMKRTRRRWKWIKLRPWMSTTCYTTHTRYMFSEPGRCPGRLLRLKYGFLLALCWAITSAHVAKTRD